MAISHNNKYAVSGGDDNTLRIWDLLKKRQKTVLKTRICSTKSVAITRSDKYVVSGEFDNTVRVWKLKINSKNSP